jgi:hypothetical protein
MADKKDNTVSSEVESRLDELFMEDDDSVFRDSDDYNDSANHELRDLKAVVLSIDWEISDEIMTGLMEQIKKLVPLYKNDRILTLFLQLLASVGKYIKVNKSAAHPHSIKLLSTVYHSFEKAVISQDLKEADRKRLLQEQVNHFKELKNQISIKKEAAEKKSREADEPSPIPKSEPAPEPIERIEPKPEPALEQVKPAKTEMSPELAAVLEEIKETIRQEFKSLKEELKLWRGGR